LLVLIYSHYLIYPPVSLYIFNHTATSEISTLSLHDALPICSTLGVTHSHEVAPGITGFFKLELEGIDADDKAESSGIDGLDEARSEEHTSELQSRENLVCRLLLEKKNT